MLWLWLLTGPQTTSFPGLFRATIGFMEDELHWPRSAIERCLAEIEAVKPNDSTPMMMRDKKTGLFFLPAAMAYNGPKNPNVAKAWAKAASDMPECELRDKAVSSALSFLEPIVDSDGKPYAKWFAESFANGSSNDIRIQKQKQKQKQKTELIAPAPLDADASAPSGANESFELPSLEAANERPQDFKPTVLATVLYEAWAKRNRAHDRGKAIKLIVGLLTKRSVPFSELVAAFNSYSDAMDAKGCEPEFRKSAANFFDGSWVEWSNGAPKQPGPNGLHQKIKGLLTTLFDWQSQRDVFGHLAELEAAHGKEVAETVRALVKSGGLRRISDGNERDVDQNLTAELAIVKGATQ